jgi:hypothetical protein
MWELIVGALGVWFGLAVAIGHTLDRQARDAAWNRIATSRRISEESARRLEEQTVALLRWQEALEHRGQQADR